MRSVPLLANPVSLCFYIFRSGSPTESQGIVSQSKKDPSAFTYKANSRLPTAISRYLPGSGLYYVLNTDYINYAIIWSCTNLGLIHTGK